MRSSTIPSRPRALLRAAALPRHSVAFDPRTPLAFPHGRLAVLLILLAALSMSGFARPAGGARATTAAAAAAADPRALCFGPLDMREELAPSATDRWEICYRRGIDVARLHVLGSGATDFDCVVYAPDGRVVAHDDDRRDACRLTWRVRVTGNHRVEIHNLGEAPNAYALVTR